MNNEHVEFALEKWAEAKGYKTSRHHISGRVFIWYPSEDESRHAMPRPIISLNFCAKLPIKDWFNYFFALADVLNIVELTSEWDYSEYKAIHNATVNQRLEAYYEAENDSLVT